MIVSTYLTIDVKEKCLAGYSPAARWRLRIMGEYAMQSKLMVRMVFLLSLLVMFEVWADSGDNSTANQRAVKENQYDPFVKADSVIPLPEKECSFGVSWADFDADSFPDLFVSSWWPSEIRFNAMYHNNGDGTFSKISDQAPAHEGNALAVVWGDFDNDGDNDLFMARFVPNVSGTNNRMYLNDGRGNFTQVQDSPVVTDTSYSVHAISADFDNDGDLDLLVGNHCARVACEAFYYRNNRGVFDRIPLDSIGLASGDFGAVAAADIDDDGDLDFIHARNSLLSLFYMNRGDGTFESINNAISTDSARTYCWGDFDNDSDFDLCAMNNWSDGPILYKNDGKGRFVKEFMGLIDTSLTTADGKPYAADYDNDGDLDLLIVNQGERYTAMPSILFKNLGDGRFSRVQNSIFEADSGASSGAAWADYDRDGDLDLFISRTNFDHSALYRNDLDTVNNWISVRCVGTNSNRSGIGAKIRVKAKIGGKDVWQLRQISSQSGFFGQDEMRAHFGLGDASEVDSLIVKWSGGGADILTNIDARQMISITQGMNPLSPR